MPTSFRYRSLSSCCSSPCILGNPIVQTKKGSILSQITRRCIMGPNKALISVQGRGGRRSMSGKERAGAPKGSSNKSVRLTNARCSCIETSDPFILTPYVPCVYVYIIEWPRAVCTHLSGGGAARAAGGPYSWQSTARFVLPASLAYVPRRSPSSSFSLSFLLLFHQAIMPLDHLDKSILLLLPSELMMCSCPCRSDFDSAHAMINTELSINFLRMMN